MIGDFSALLLAIFINFGMSFLVASFITFLILERESKVNIVVYFKADFMQASSISSKLFSTRLRFTTLKFKGIGWLDQCSIISLNVYRCAVVLPAIPPANFRATKRRSAHRRHTCMEVHLGSYSSCTRLRLNYNQITEINRL